MLQLGTYYRSTLISSADAESDLLPNSPETALVAWPNTPAADSFAAYHSNAPVSQ